MTVRSLSEVFLPGAAELPERLRTLTVTPTRFVEPGTTVEATFGFYNSGGATATGLRVRFALPEGLQYIEGSAQIDAAPQTGNADGDFVAPGGALLGEIAPGVERRVSVAYRVADFIEDGTTLVVQAALAANETLIVGSNIVRLVARSRPNLANPQTVVTLEAPAGAEPGRELLMRARVTNQGQSSASDVVLVFPVPENTRYSPRTARIDGRLLQDERVAPFDASASTIVAERLAPGQSVIADYIAVIESPLDNGTAIYATARLSSREIPEFEIASNEITVASMPNFEGDGTALIVGGDDEVVPGKRLRMELRAFNAGTSSARRVVAQFTLPNGLVYSPGSTTLDGLPVGDDLFESMAYAFETILPGRAVQLAFDAVVVAPAPPDAKLPVRARLQWESGERSFNRTLTIRSEPRFTRAKNVIERGGPPIAQPGEEVPFIVHILNEGTAEASNARLLVRSDATLAVSTVEMNGIALPVVDDAIVLGTIPPHVEHLVNVNARIASPLPDKAEVTFAAELVTAQLGTMDLGVASYSIRSRPRFATDECRMELRTKDALRPSRPVQMAIRVKNSGTDVARDVRVILSFPPEIAVTAINGAPFIKGELIFETLLPGTVREAFVAVSLASFVPSGSLVSIEARIEAGGLAPLALNTVAIETRAQADFSGELQLHATPPQDVDAGKPLAFDLRFRNIGDGPAQAIVARVRPPEQTIYMPLSTTVNGMKVDDENGTSPLWSLHGLVLTDVDPGVPVRIHWESIVTSPIASGTRLSAQATLEWEEQNLTVVCDDVVVNSSPEFASSPGGRSLSIARLTGQTTFPGAAPQSPEPPVRLAQPRPVDARPTQTQVLREEAPSGPVFDAPFTVASSAGPEPAASRENREDARDAREVPAPQAAETDEFDLPFFSAPPSNAAEAEAEYDHSAFALVEPPEQPALTAEAHGAVDFSAPPDFAATATEQLVDFSAPPTLAGTPPATAPSLPPPAAEPVFAEPVAATHEQPTTDSHAFILEPVEDEAEPAFDEPPVAAAARPEAQVAVAVEETRPPAIEAVPAALVPLGGPRMYVAAPVSLLAFAPDRLRRTLSFLQQSDYGKLVSHLFALEAFFPDRIADEPELDDLFVGVRDAFRSTLDRLFVRLRLPRYAIAARDLEDRSSREAMLTLTQRVTNLPPIENVHPLGPVGAGIRVKGPIDIDSLRHAAAGLQDAPLGGVTPWIACVSMLGTTVETAHESMDVLGEYRDTLLSVLRVLESLPMSEFHRVLTNSSNAELDKALNDVVRVLGGPVETSVR